MGVQVRKIVVLNSIFVLLNRTNVMMKVEIGAKTHILQACFMNDSQLFTFISNQTIYK